MEGREITVSSSTANRETDSLLSQPLPNEVVDPQERSICGEGVGNGVDMTKGKKKRGRPRKYGPEGSIAMAASQGFSSPPSEFALKQNRGPPALLSTGSGNQQQIPHSGPEGSTSSAFSQGFYSPNQNRGPPTRGSGNRQQIPTLGELVADVEGRDFTLHMVTIHTGEVVVGSFKSNDKSCKRKNHGRSPMPSATPGPQDMGTAARPISQLTPDDDTCSMPTSALRGQGPGEAENSSNSNLNPDNAFQSADWHGSEH